MFITFEGIDGCGKSTHAKLLSDFLNQKGFRTLILREPGGTDFSEKIREILLTSDYELNPQIELLLFEAARSHLTQNVINIELQSGTAVISDRFFDSTYAYQAYARRLPNRLVAIFNRFASAGLKPDLTFLVDIDIPDGQARGKCVDRMEKQDFSYHKKVREGYLRLARRAKKRIRVLDGKKSVDILKEEVVNYVKDLLNRKG
jgi:dTMP kinase